MRPFFENIDIVVFFVNVVAGMIFCIFQITLLEILERRRLKKWQREIHR